MIMWMKKKETQKNEEEKIVGVGGGENILWKIYGRFSLDLWNIFNRIWKFPYFLDFPRIYILAYAEHSRVDEKHIFP